MNADDNGIHYGVIPIRDLDGFVTKDFYDNSENIVMNSVESEIDEIFEELKTFVNDKGVNKEIEIETLKESIKYEIFENWDESEDSRLYEHDGYKIELIGNDLFIAESPYVTLGPLCSPCAPGAVYLPDADGKRGFMAYCLPKECFEDGKAPYEYITIEEGYNKLWKQLYPEDNMPSLIADMNELMRFLYKKETEETDLDVLHWIRNLRTNIILLIESAATDPNGDKVKFYLTSVRLQIGMVNEMKRRVEDENY